MNYRDKIRTIAKARDIRYLLHFTQAVNLPGIVEHGFLPRRELLKTEYLARPSDRYRLDDNEDAVSISISRVNEVMFDSKRYKSGHSNWVILVLSPEILWKYSCRFCWCNAARREIKDHRGWREGPWAFAEMFAGSNDARSGLAPSYPTDPEAEVQVLECIAPKYILAAVVDRPELVEPVRAILSNSLGKLCEVIVEAF